MFHRNDAPPSSRAARTSIAIDAGSPFALLSVHNERRFANGSKVREESAGQSREGDARAEEGHTQERKLGQESEEPQASHRHRTLRSAPRRRQGAVEEVVIEEIELEEIVVKEVFVQEVQLEEVVFEEVVEEEVALKLSGFFCVHLRMKT
jgi:hypothetical protein